MKFPFILLLLITLNLQAHTQPAWKLVKEKNGIKIFLASVANSKFKSVRVQSIMEGTIFKLINILSNINEAHEWVYKTKTAYFLKRITPYDFLYYTETILPWPASNRDAVIHIIIKPDTVHHAVRISAVSEPKFMAEKNGIVRIPYSKASWYVTESGNKINMDYIFEVDPGGSLPAWLVNMMADKGPYESFEKLMLKLRK